MSDSGVPETSVLAIASHVAYGYVGNTMATFVMQSLGCEVTAINTVHYSNHTGYKQVKGRKASAEEILELYEGLVQSELHDAFDVLLSGYMPSADAVAAVGRIARDLRALRKERPGGFFWVLDPVMGDNGHLYIPSDCVPQYKSLLPHANLILPNQFETETLSDTQITDLQSLASAVHTLHKQYEVPHVVVTSLRLDKADRTVAPGDDSGIVDGEDGGTLTIIGSTSTSSHAPRLFRIDVPAYSIFFSGTGDMFAALTVARLREAAAAADLLGAASWKSGDGVKAVDLPLAKACASVCASMAGVLGKTAAEVSAWEEREAKVVEWEDEHGEKRRHLRRTRAAEVRVVRNVGELVRPVDVERFAAKAVDVDI